MHIYSIIKLVMFQNSNKNEEKKFQNKLFSWLSKSLNK
jgi:hypothetical protein